MRAEPVTACAPHPGRPARVRILRTGVAWAAATVPLLLAPAGLYAVTRHTVMATAEQYASLRWYCSTANADAYYNDYTANTWNTGMAYNWGGMDSIDQFMAKISQGAVAGTTRSDYTHSDFGGVDCSGFVLRCWGYTTHAYSTASLYRITAPITWADLKAGDVLNLAGSHVRLFEQYDADPTRVWVYESTGGVTPAGVTHRRLRRSDMESGGYLPLRFLNIQDYAPPPTPLSPGLSTTPGALVGSTRPAFTWQAAPEATGYGLYVMDEATGTVVYPNLAGTTSTPLAGTSFALPAGLLQGGHSYAWAMTSFTGGAESPTFSSVLYFRTPGPFGDFDRDGDIDQEDFGHLQACFTEPTVLVSDPCFDADLNQDRFVDQRDLVLLQRCQSGPGAAPDPDCGETP